MNWIGNENGMFYYIRPSKLPANVTAKAIDTIWYYATGYSMRGWL